MAGGCPSGCSVIGMKVSVHNSVRLIASLASNVCRVTTSWTLGGASWRPLMAPQRSARRVVNDVSQITALHCPYRISTEHDRSCRSRSQFDVLGRSESLNNARPPVAHHTTRQPNRPVNHTMRDEMNGQHHETHFAI